MGVISGYLANKLLLFLPIGRRGAVIQKLREEHGVNIQVPPSNASSDEERSNQIRLIGYEQNCMNAKEAIESIIRELVRSYIQSHASGEFTEIYLSHLTFSAFHITSRLV